MLFRSEVRRRRAAEGDARHVVLARAHDPAAAHDAVGVRAQDPLEQHPGRIRGGPGDIIANAGIERRQVELVLEQVMHRVLDSAGQELLRQIDGSEAGIRIDVLLPGHAPSSRRSEAIAMRAAFLHDSHEVFLQPRCADVRRCP